MRGERTRLLQLSLVVADLVATTLAFLLSYWLRGSLLSYYWGEIYPLRRYQWIYLVAALSLPIILSFLKDYQVDRVVRRDLYRRVWAPLQAVVLEYVLISVVGFSLKLHYVSRLLAFSFVVSHFVLLVLTRLVVWPVFLRRAQREPLGVVVVGSEEEARALASRLTDQPQIGTHLLGLVVDGPSGSRERNGFPVLGSTEELESILSRHVVDEVIVTTVGKSPSELESLLFLCEQRGVTARLACDFLPRRSARLGLEHLQGLPLLTLTTAPVNANLLAMKRMIDLLLGSALLLLSLPLLILTAFLIKLTSRGPVLYKQTRCGLNGRRFTFLKFRSMVAGADEKRKEIEHLNEAQEPIFKMAFDPRVTWLGKILRRTSIDELPQLFNVLRGEMSLVGPRPPLPEEVEKYELGQRRRLSMKPGLTCLWQVSGRSVLSFDEWVSLDLQYIDNWSLGLDIRILVKTIPAVLFWKGAY
jgi:exopolysaccharide biosynthesis polyprenyl glycosylphosphotransferase